MSSAATEYEKLKAMLETQQEVTAGQMFGKACLKVNGKAFVSLHGDKLVFKLTGEYHQKAMSLKHAQLWDPSGKGHAMKEWVALPVEAAQHFKQLAAAALAYVKHVQ